jgi:hypothetical protein
MGTINPFGRHGKMSRGQRIRDEEAAPYKYETVSRRARWIRIAFAIWIGLAILAAYADYQERSVLGKWQDVGFTTVPPTADPVGLVAYAREIGNPCQSLDLILADAPECSSLVDFSSELDSTNTFSSIVFGPLVFMMIILSVQIGTFAYQTNRNILTLKSIGQYFSSTSALIWMYIPLINFYKGIRIFNEIWKASDPVLGSDSQEAWKKGSTNLLIPTWWLSFALVIVLGLILRRSLLDSNIIDDRMDIAGYLIAADLYYAVPAILAAVAVTRITDRQDARREIVGDYLATPPIKGFDL